MESKTFFINVLKEIKINGSIDASVMEELSPEERQLIKELQGNNLLEEALFYANSIDVEQNWGLFQQRIASKEKVVSSKWKQFLQYAAVIALLLGGYFAYQFNTSETANVVIPSDAIQLVMENGDIQILNSKGEKKIVKKDGEIIASQKDNQINYNSVKSADKLVYNEIKIPYGKTFVVTLSDGTVVNMNSGSSLRYPVRFIKGYNREVVLSGEAFFDVTKDKLHPFIVKSDAVNIKVLGTKFNVSSYEEDQDVNTVLVEGSVSLSNTVIPTKKTILIPGEKGSWNKVEEGMSVEKVDTQFYTQWMKGDLVFRKTSFRDIIVKLERAYDVKIESKRNDLLNKKFNASFNKNIESIEEVLQAISKIQNFRFKREGKNIKIT